MLGLLGRSQLVEHVADAHRRERPVQVGRVDPRSDVDSRRACCDFAADPIDHGFELGAERSDVGLGQDRPVTRDHGVEIEGQQAGQRGRPLEHAATVTEVPERRQGAAVQTLTIDEEIAGVDRTEIGKMATASPFVWPRPK